MIASHIQPESSNVQAWGEAAPAQLAYTGTGLWPIYPATAILLAGVGLLLLVMRRVNPGV
ncbi:hypothetical protein CVS29_06065 [Arthrobacter psychrochitiniphilus]|uniref:Uncharacterized protein n=1 Tax=Arthrobacter psychrochitiniphilus TaxID=291045 RepID=A0A2V3DSN7_9MICC|nr:hypothetical protein CVS29_06065 [Arthrobacter psychrochitiniphilus]